MSDYAIPKPNQLDCCWQAQEKLTLKYNDIEHVLIAVSSLQNDTLTLVILDPIGRRVATITQSSEKLTVAPETIKESLPIKPFLLGFYIRHLPTELWSEFKQYAVRQEIDGEKQLLLKNKTIVTMSTLENTSLLLTYPNTKFEVIISEQSREAIQ